MTEIDVSRQWHPQTRSPDPTCSAASAGSISDFSNYNSVVFDNALPLRGSGTSTIKDYDRIGDTMASSHSSVTSNLIEMANRPSSSSSSVVVVDDDTINLHYDYRNDEFSPASIINSAVATDIVDKPTTAGDVTCGTGNSFNSTFNEFLERTYNLVGGPDHYHHHNHHHQQHHSAYLSPLPSTTSHSGSTSSGTIVDPSNIDHIPYDFCDEPIPNSDNTQMPSTSLSSRVVDAKPTDAMPPPSLLDDEFRSSESTLNAVHSYGGQINGNDEVQGVDVIKALLNSDIDVEEEIPSVVVAVEPSKVCENASTEAGDEDFAWSGSDDEECPDKAELINL